MKKNTTKYIAAIIIGLIIGASILGYGYLDYRYKQEIFQQKVKSEEQAQLDITKRQQQLQDCLNTPLIPQKTQRVYSQSQQKFIELPVSPIATPDLKNLSTEEIKFIFDLAQKQKDNCFKQYPQ
jgi:hypothetical protein